jgi:hypothetical protein
MSTIKKIFKSYIVEARFTPLIASILVIVFRFLLFSYKGIPNYRFAETGFVWSYLAPYFENEWVSFISSTLCVFLIAGFISQINLHFGVIRARTALPFVFPLILFSVHPIFLMMNSYYIGAIFVLWAFFPLLETHQRTNSRNFVFQGTVLLALASVFEIYTLFFIPLWWIGYSRMGGFNFKMLLASLWGLILVYWIVFAFFVFGDNLQEFIAPFLYFARFDFHTIPAFTLPQWGFIGTSLIFLIAFLIMDFKYIRHDKVITQKTISFIFVVIGLSLVFLALYGEQSVMWIYIILAFESLILSHLYSITTSNREIFSFFVLLLILIYYYLVNCFTEFSPF